MSPRVHTESVPLDLLKIWGFRDRTDGQGGTYRILAQTFIAYGVGYASVDAVHFKGSTPNCVVEFIAGRRVVNVSVAGVVMNLQNHSSFARSFNEHVRPRVIDEARRIGVIGGAS